MRHKPVYETLGVNIQLGMKFDEFIGNLSPERVHITDGAGCVRTGNGWTEIHSQ